MHALASRAPLGALSTTFQHSVGPICVLVRAETICAGLFEWTELAEQSARARQYNHVVWRQIIILTRDMPSKLKVSMPTPNTRIRTQIVIVSTPWAALSCRGPVRVTFRCMYHFVLKTGTFTGSCLLTMGSHHTNRLSGPIP